MHLGTQLLAGTFLVIVMTIVHGLGVVGVTRLLRLEDEALKAHRLNQLAGKGRAGRAAVQWVKEPRQADRHTRFMRPRAARAYT